jgi:uncharacterized protein YbgA (DUF1722 family)
LEFRLQAVPRYAAIMAATGYLWRQLNQKQREELLEWRKSRAYPWHSTSAPSQLWTSAISHFGGLL